MDNILFGNFANYGFVDVAVPESVLKSIRQETENFPAHKLNYGLAGNIEHEYSLSDSIEAIQEFVVPVCREYNNAFSPVYSYHKMGYDDFVMERCWVNYQKKYEFNPPHTHNGSFSFVIFLQIPYLLQDEHERANVKDSNNPRAGMFTFQYQNIFGELLESPQPVDKNYEGRMFLFPSIMSHSVYPFYTSDDYRITVSGNLFGVENAI